MKMLLISLFLLGIAGCATTPKIDYTKMYNDAIHREDSIMITKEGDFDTMKDAVEQQLKSIGYSDVLFSSPTESCTVFVKDVDYGSPLLSDDAKSCQIILKYTKIEAGKTRIDLVNGAAKPSVKAEVERDIQKLSELIKSN